MPMLRISILITGLLLIIYSCNNNISSIGQELINNTNHIGENNLSVYNMGTIKVDSFVTSCGQNSSSYITKLVMGRYEDPVYGGTTTAIPCFQVVPSYIPSISYSAVLDSLTLNFTYAGNMWGDTLYNVKSQTFNLYQLKKLPDLNYEDNTLFYNTTPVDTNKLIATTTFLPLKANMNISHFKLDKTLAEDLFDRMVYRTENDIYQPSSGIVPYIGFLDYFKGLAIVPAGDNDCLMTIHALSDSLYLQFHYTEAGTNKTISFPLGQTEYQYNRIITQPSSKFAALTDQKQEVMFETSASAIVQGLSGYMIKMEQPQPPGYSKYTTIIRAQLEIKPDIYSNMPIALPASINVYTTNDINEVTGFLADKNGNIVTGRLNKDEVDLKNSRYIFDLTEYYQKLSDAPELPKNPQILLSVPNDGLSSSGISFDQMIVLENPTIRIHYANYK